MVVDGEKETGDAELDLDELLRKLYLLLVTPGILAATKLVTKFDDAPH